jgi:short subunit dehydrogenase
MAVPKSEFISTNVWRDDLFSKLCSLVLFMRLFIFNIHWIDYILLESKVVFCTGGAGTICSTQVRALVYLGADACIIGRNVEKTEKAAKDIATVRSGARVIGIGAIDVRSFDNLKNAADRCVRELGGIDFVMYVHTSTSSFDQCCRKSYRSRLKARATKRTNADKTTCQCRRSRKFSFPNQPALRERLQIGNGY